MFTLSLLSALPLSSKLHAQPGADPSQPPPPIDVRPETPELKAAIERLREHMFKMNEVAVRYNASPKEQDEQYQEQWYGLHTEGRQIFEQMLLAAVKEFQEDPEKRYNVARWLYRILDRNVEKDQFEGMLPVAKALLADRPETEELNLMFVLTAFAMNEFQAARNSIDFLIANGQPSPELLDMRDSIDTNTAAWGRRTTDSRAGCTGRALATRVNQDHERSHRG